MDPDSSFHALQNLSSQEQVSVDMGCNNAAF